jgi:hypothetical protein
MQLSPALLSGLATWSNRTSCCPGERQLAKQLLQDFSQAGPALPVLAGTPAGSCGLIGVEYEPQVAVHVVADRTVVGAGCTISE